MSLNFTYLIREPYLRLIIEYFDNSNRCTCNYFVDDVWNLSMVNKEVRKYIIENKLLSCIRYHLDVPNDLRNFFRINSICWKHHITNLNPDHIHHLFQTIRKVKFYKEKYTEFPTEKLQMSNGEFEFLKRVKNHEHFEFFHCKSSDHAEEIKHIIQTYGMNMYKGNSCCNGTGFSLLIKYEK